jgi:hypothetical protein
VNRDLRLLLFAHPRSGSSSLYQILQLHPQLNLLEEPFNGGFVSWKPGNVNYLERIHDIASLDEQVEEILSGYNGLKLLNYQLSQELTDHLLLRPDFKIIFLRRRNLLQAVVSLMMAHQTNLWKKWEMTKELGEYYRTLQPLDIGEVQETINVLQEELDYYDRTIMQRSAEDVIRLTYEGLFLATPKEQDGQVAAIWRKLGVGPLRSEKIQYYLRPESAKLNTAESYQLLPNAQEIEDRCGNDVTGWLFR